MDPTLKRIATYGSEFEAFHAKSCLEHQGINAYVDGTTAATVLSYFGSAVSGARLYVQDTDVNSALTFLESLEFGSPSEDSAWYCSHCCEPVDVGFENCWKCGRDRQEASGPSPVKTGSSNVPSDFESIFDASNTRYAAPSANPYAAPSGELHQNESDSSNSDEINIEADAILERAWRSTVIGFVLFPIVLHIYSTCLLIYASWLTSKFSSKGKRLFYWTLALNLLTGIVCGIALYFFVVMNSQRLL